MSFSAATGSVTQANVSQGSHTVDVTLNGSWTITGGDYADYAYSYFFWSENNGSSYGQGPFNTSYAEFGVRYPIGGLGVGAGTQPYSWIVGDSQPFYSPQSKLTTDKNCAFYAEVKFTNCNGFSSDIRFKDGSVIYFKSYAIDPTLSSLTSSAITASTATITALFYPNTDVSSATVQLEYRIFGSGSGFTVAGSTAASSGYAQDSISRNLTGLTGSTTYEYRLTMTRTTANSTTFTSSSNIFTTSVATPSITTNTATSIGANTATINGTVNPNTFSTSYYFQYGLTTSYGSTTATQGPSSGSSDIPYSAGPTGLTSSTLYHFRAVATYSGGTVNGSDATFTTSADPTVEALAQGRMNKFEYDATYGVQKAFSFFVESPAATSSDRVLNAAVPWIAGDVKISIDGGASANVTNLPTRIGSTPEYTITLTAAELSGENIKVRLVDADGPAWRDTILMVRTKIEVGQLNITATAYGSNTTAMTVTGVGTSPALSAAGGATSAGDITGVLTSMVIRKSIATAGGASTVTLDASASATDNWYNNCIAMIISGTGAGQFRIITGYVGSTKVATVHSSWNTNPAASSVVLILPTDDVWNIVAAGELSALPTATSKFSQFIQFLFQRFAYNRTQTSSTQTLFKADSSTSLASGTVSDNGTTQTSGKLA